MRRQRNIKIVATLGPSSSDYDTIKALHLAGADVFRLNMSHGSHEEIAERHEIIRQIEAELNSPIAILADLQGPKLRVGTFKNGVEEITENEKFRLDLKDEVGTKDRVQLPHPEIFQALHEGAHLLINDGKIKLMVEKLNWLVWLILVILWNFGFPEATPLQDVVVAVILSLLFIIIKLMRSRYLHKISSRSKNKI